MSRFTDILTVSPLADGHTWVTRKEFGYDVGSKESNDKIDVPIGFMTDFASVPQPFWIILPRWGKYGNAAVIHDYLYKVQTRSRRKADGIFREGMGVLAVPGWQIFCMYWAVRLLGWLAWQGSKRANKRGVIRIALILPEKSIEKAKTLRARQS